MTYHDDMVKLYNSMIKELERDKEWIDARIEYIKLMRDREPIDKTIYNEGTAEATVII